VQRSQIVCCRHSSRCSCLSTGVERIRRYATLVCWWSFFQGRISLRCRPHSERARVFTVGQSLSTAAVGAGDRRQRGHADGRSHDPCEGALMHLFDGSEATATSANHRSSSIQRTAGPHASTAATQPPMAGQTAWRRVMTTVAALSRETLTTSSRCLSAVESSHRSSTPPADRHSSEFHFD
jgi:hypothetical protein